MSNQILLSFGASQEGAVLCDAIKEYAQDIGTTQKTLLMMALYEYMLVNKEFVLAGKIERYQNKDSK